MVDPGGHRRRLAFRASPGLAGRLNQAEANLAQLQSKYARPEVFPTVERLVVDLEQRVERATGRFEPVVVEAGSAGRRQEVRQLIGRFKVEADARDIRRYNEQGRLEAALSRAVGATDARNSGSGGLLPIQATPLLGQHSVEISTDQRTAAGLAAANQLRLVASALDAVMYPEARTSPARRTLQCRFLS